MLIDQYNQVKENVKQACKRAGRDPREVTIIAVSKTKPLEMIEELRREKVKDFGENKVQELKEKYEKISWPVRWHLIGHLQTNKVKYIVDKAALIHSVDSVHLAKQINKEAAKHQMKEVPILIQVNFAHEDTKFGFSPEEATEAIREIAALEHVKVKGLMQIAPFVENPEENREYFRAMKQLSVDIENKNFDNVDMSILSMGMTNDYEVAVEEGATMIRVGTGIFGERNYSI
ncbi:MAG TPA: YggS family pyridoxal phosphate-dependent enzyme [Candidatus Anaerostipes excrementavium]|uniref:Pyridoxal phosphate homeostasis protein n=1 Tax=Candidatus Anaerostipes excrementavium TaxID=2838463 RepID=A0A9D1WYN3_9FIRM|nr:YggS family pyridoxal phosphate-dependent enzyme [uncultured Anaerostipes sp.]HIX68420.1 YggS family pyridoxal phosphate-dependent enzyme [Candidatus Anaerostipes excrementavium]